MVNFDKIRQSNLLFPKNVLCLSAGQGPKNTFINGICTGMHIVDVFLMLFTSSQECVHTRTHLSEKPSEASDILCHGVCVGISGLRGDNYNLHSAGCCRDANTSRRRDSDHNTNRANCRVHMEAWERQKWMEKRINQQFKYERIYMPLFISHLSVLRWVWCEIQLRVWYGVLYRVASHMWKTNMFRGLSSTKDQ